MSLTITGIQTVGDRCFIYIDIDHNGQIYKWIDYDLSFEQVAAKESVYTDYIDLKELEWEELEPKTRTIESPMGGEPITVPISKEEIVCPPPDYVALRKAEYPPIADYLDGVVKNDEAQIDTYIDACQAVKEKYPKSYT